MKRPRSTLELVAAALLRTRLSRGAESACLALAAGLGAASAAELSGASAGTLPVLAVATLCAAACGATWWREHRGSAAEVARAADRRLAQDGALVTAFESELRGGLAALLAARTLGALPDGSLARAAPGPALAFLAAPLAAAALLSAVAQRVQGPGPGAFELAGRASAASARAAGSSGDPRAAELARLAAGAVEAAETGAGSPAEAAQALLEVQARLEELVAERSARGEFDPELWAARDLVQDAARGLSQGAPGGAPGAGGAEPAATKPSAALKKAPSGRTMSGSQSEGRSPPTPSDAPTGAAAEAEVGTVAGRWWPRQYDDLVARWLATQ